MYCSTCGAVLPANLTYCNRCGARVGSGAETTDKPQPAFSESLVWAIVSLFLGGLGVIIGLMAVMKNVAKLDPFIVVDMIFLSFTLLVLIESVLVWLLISSRRQALKSQSNRLAEKTTRELEEARPLSLAEPLTSVTEHTTRSFEPVYVEQKLK